MEMTMMKTAQTLFPFDEDPTRNMIDGVMMMMMTMIVMATMTMLCI